MSLIKVTKDDEWYTPAKLVNYFGQFDYDPATNDYKAREFNIPNYDTIETNGLLSDWSKYKRIWINPPFTLKKEFLIKAMETLEKKPDIEIFILLPINFLITKTFFERSKGGIIYLPNSRIQFESGNGRKATSSPAFGQVIIKLSNDGNFTLTKINLKSII